MLTVSHNELSALLKRTFESLLGHGCDYEAFAAQILWLECHGLNGIGILRDCVDQLQIGGLPPVLTHSDSSQDRALYIDLQGRSLICMANMLADLSITRGKHDGVCQIEASNCYELTAIIPQLDHIWQSGLYAAAWVTDREGAAVGFATSLGSTELPNLSGWHIHDGARSFGTLTLVAAPDEEALRERIDASQPVWPMPDVTAEMLDQRFQDGLCHGLPMGDIGFLYGIADRILIAATEESRLGAGE